MNLEENKLKAPFTVPQQYFEELEGLLLSEVKISTLSKLQVPTVPHHYFDSLEKEILSQVTLTKNLKQEVVPTAYFEELESNLLSRIKIEGLMQEKVEESYFDQLEQQILAQTKIKDLPKEQNVPVGYFDFLEADILAKTIEQKKSKFTIWRNFKVLRPVAAALVIGASIFGVMQYTNNTSASDQFAQISSEAMLAYLAEQPLMAEDLSFALENEDIYLTTGLSDNAIEDYLLDNGL